MKKISFIILKLVLSISFSDTIYVKSSNANHEIQQYDSLCMKCINDSIIFMLLSLKRELIEVDSLSKCIHSNYKKISKNNEIIQSRMKSFNASDSKKQGIDIRIDDNESEYTIDVTKKIETK